MCVCVCLFVLINCHQLPPTATNCHQVCAEHKKPAKLLKHLESVRSAAAGLRNAPKVLVFANKVGGGVGEGGW